MKILYTFTLICYTFSLSAQTAEPFRPFGEMMDYHYTNPFIGEDQELEGVSPVLGVTAPYDQFDGVNYSGYELPDQAVPGTQSGRISLRPHFAASIYEGEQESIEFHAYSGDGDARLRIRYASPVGESWEAAAGIVATVDSVRVMHFLGVQDEVKFISFNGKVGSTIPDLLLSSTYGMIEGPWLSDAYATEQALKLVSLRSLWGGVVLPGENGEDYITTADVGFIEVGTKYYFESRSPATLNGAPGKRIYQSVVTISQMGCDPILGGTNVQGLKRSLNYFTPDGIGPNLDTLLEPSVQIWEDLMFLAESAGSETDWRTLPLGSVFFDEEENQRTVVLPTVDECMRAGKQLSPPLTYLGDTNEYDLAAELDRPQIFRGVMFYETPLGYLDNSVIISPLIGVDNTHELCGSSIDFGDAFVSTTTFPDDPRITLHPNPATERVSILIPFDLGDQRVTTYDAQGRVVATTQLGRGGQTLLLGNLKPGLYTVVLYSEDDHPTARRRLVIR